VAKGHVNMAGHAMLRQLFVPGKLQLVLRLPGRLPADAACCCVA
jgi:hypothetical protein